MLQGANIANEGQRLMKVKSNPSTNLYYLRFPIQHRTAQWPSQQLPELIQQHIFTSEHPISLIHRPIQASYTDSIELLQKSKQQ